MTRLFAAAFLALGIVASGAACSKQPQQAAPAQPAASDAAQAQPAEAAPAAAAPATTEESAPTAPTETVTETDDAPAATTDQAASGVQPTLRLAAATNVPASEHFKEGTNYRKVVPAQPTNVAPGKVEVVEFFWYGCGHCFALDPAMETWRAKSKPQYVEFTRVPAMWNDALRMHARLYYTAEALGKLDELHSAIFREIHVNNNQLSTLPQITAFFKQHGVGPDDFQKAFASFAVESKLQRADFLNRRFGIDSVPQVAVNGKYLTDQGKAGGEPELFQLVQELAAHEHGG